MNSLPQITLEPKTRAVICAKTHTKEQLSTWPTAAEFWALTNSAKLSRGSPLRKFHSAFIEDTPT